MTYNDIEQALREKWEDIPGYEGLYQVSNKGRIKSIKGKSNKIKDQEVMKHGYKRVNLYKDGKLKKFLVHRLVAEAFLTKNIQHTEVNHINGKTYDNRSINLEWVTTQENSHHKSVVLNRKPRGVYKDRNHWRSQIVYNQNKINIGTFKTKEEAYKSFYEYYIKLRGTAPWDINEYKTH